MCHLLSPPMIGSFYIAPLNSQYLGHQVSISTGRFYLLFHNFCTRSSSLQGWSLHPPCSKSPVGVCHSQYQHLYILLPPCLKGNCGSIGPGEIFREMLMLMVSGCGEAFWSIRGGDESMESNKSGFAELSQMCLATLPLFLEEN